MNRTQKPSSLHRAASKIKFLSVSVAICCLASSTNAVVILSNLGNVDGGGEEDLTMNGGNATTRIRGAIGFTIGGVEQSGNFLFTVRLNNPGAEVISLRLVNDNSGAPTGSEITFANPSSSTTISGGGLGYELSWNGGTLLANTRYWIVAAVEGAVTDSATWIDRGSYTANGASFYQAQADAFGGWTQLTPGNLSLGIDVTPAPDRPRILWNLVGSQIQLIFNTVPDQTYYLQLNTNLVSTNWSNVQTNAGDGSIKTNLITPTGPEGYYRLLRN